MKLSLIQQINNTLPNKLRTLLRETTSHKVFENINLSLNSKPYFYEICFLESINEAGRRNNYLNSLVNTGLVNIQSALTPDIPDNIDPVIKLMAPNGGGIESIKDILNKAKQIRGSIFDDKDWFNSLFKIFNITDQEEITNIINKLRTDFNMRPNKLPKNNAVDNSNQTKQTQDNDPTLINKIKSTGDNNNKLKDVISRLNQNKAKAQNELFEINKRIQELMAKCEQQPTNESINEIIDHILIEPDVYNNLHVIIPNSLRKFGILESDIKQTMKNFFKQAQSSGSNIINNIKNTISNPIQTQQRLNDWQSTSNNILISKYAVRYCLNSINNKFELILKQHNYSPLKFRELYLIWKNKNNGKYTEKQILIAKQALLRICKIFKVGLDQL